MGFFICLLSFSYCVSVGFFCIFIPFHPSQYIFYERTNITVTLLLHTSTSAVPGKLSITITSSFIAKLDLAVLAQELKSDPVLLD